MHRNLSHTRITTITTTRFERQGIKRTLRCAARRWLLGTECNPLCTPRAPIVFFRVAICFDIVGSRLVHPVLVIFRPVQYAKRFTLSAAFPSSMFGLPLATGPSCFSGRRLSLPARPNPIPSTRRYTRNIAACRRSTTSNESEALRTAPTPPFHAPKVLQHTPCQHLQRRQRARFQNVGKKAGLQNDTGARRASLRR